jgi:hypothetical protein
VRRSVLKVTGLGALLAALVMRRRTRAAGTRSHDKPPASNWSPVERDEPSLREARSMR